MAEAKLPRTISDLVPTLACSLPQCEYNADANLVSFWLGRVLVVVYPDKVLLNRVRSRKHAEKVLERVNRLLTRLANKECRCPLPEDCIPQR